MSLAAMAIVASVTTTSAFAADAAYPDHPITLILAYPPGGGVDFVGRQLARQLESTLGQPVVVENRPGAGSLIGTNAVTRAKPDGYTLLLADPALVINSKLMASVPYVLDRDLTPVSTVTKSPLALSVPVTSPIKTLQDLIDAGKNTKKSLNFASAGIGSTPHMAGELLKLRTSGDLTHIPYKGSGLAMTDLVSGQVDFAFATLPASAPFLTQGRLRGLAVTSKEPNSFLPDLPTVNATLPGFEVYFWTALFAPANTPPAVVAKLNAAVRDALQSDAMKTGLEKAGETATYMSQEDTAKFIRDESAMWEKVIADGGIKAN
jgi:tripartite-type tricarboxylate transporter receptor subunit TctC